MKMGKGWSVIIFIIALILVVAFFQKGWDGMKEQPIQSVTDSGKIIIDTGKGAIDTGKNLYNGVSNNSDSQGRPSCLLDEDCNTITACQSDLCFCATDGDCYLK